MNTRTNDLGNLLDEFEGGRLAQDIDENLTALVQSCAETHRKGKIVITVEFKPNARGQIETTAAYKVTPPKPDAYGATFFATEHGQLTREDPRQLQLKLEEERKKEERHRRLTTPAAKPAAKSTPTETPAPEVEMTETAEPTAPLAAVVSITSKKSA